MRYVLMPSFKIRVFIAMLLMSCALVAQEPTPAQPPAAAPSTANPASPVPAPGESAADAYERAMQPVEIVRRSPNNITDSEIAAWGVAVATAAHECAARTLNFVGEELFHYARLCQLGQQYEDAYASARRYLRDGNTKNAESARALIVRSSLSAGNLLRAQNGAYDLLRSHPYDGTVHTMVQETIMALAASDALENAINMGEERHNSLMAALRAPGGLALHEGSYKIPQSTLIRDALESVYFYRAENRVPLTQAKADALIEAVRQVVSEAAPNVSAVERDAMQAAVHRAELLRTAAPPLPVETSSAKTIAPHGEIDFTKHITLLAFYAPWSPQRAQMFELLASMGRDYKTFPVQFFAVSTPAVATGDATAKPAEVLAKLLEQFGKSGNPVPVLVAADSANQDFTIDDWPMFIVIDPQGKVRFLDTLTGSEYKDGGRMHRLVAGLASQAGPVPTPPPVRSKSGRAKVPEGTLQRRPR